MMYKLHYSPESMRDLDDIWEYISVDSGSAQTAFNITDGIVDDAEQLIEFPLSGALLSSVVEIESDYRFLVSGRYIVFYRVYDNAVHISRILHGKQDFMRVLFG